MTMMRKICALQERVSRPLAKRQRGAAIKRLPSSSADDSDHDPEINDHDHDDGYDNYDDDDDDNDNDDYDYYEYCIELEF